eukprot:162603_1
MSDEAKKTNKEKNEDFCEKAIDKAADWSEDKVVEYVKEGNISKARLYMCIWCIFIIITIGFDIKAVVEVKGIKRSQQTVAYVSTVFAILSHIIKIYLLWRIFSDLGYICGENYNVKTLEMYMKYKESFDIFLMLANLASVILVVAVKDAVTSGVGGGVHATQFLFLCKEIRRNNKYNIQLILLSPLFIVGIKSDLSNDSVSLQHVSCDYIAMPENEQKDEEN